MIWNIPPIEELRKVPFRELLEDSKLARLPIKKRSTQGIKRCVDILLSLVFGIVLLPVGLFITLLIRIDSKGPAIFSHIRVGKDGKTFRLYKFRTMKTGVSAQEFAPTKPGDPRVTRIGHFLRHTSLDELPQMWNVLKGEMSLVGPRPEMEFIVRTYTDLQRKRLLAKPGLTGLWQICGRKDLPLHENVEYDLYYILHQSLWMDVLIMVKTLGVIVSGRGAY
jgi:lipopolysaccharide/colanic/teichoic acid biosynthesis glycosyltransferase